MSMEFIDKLNSLSAKIKQQAGVGDAANLLI